MTVREALREQLDIHNIEDREQRIREVLMQVELKPPERYLDQLPKQLSGGEKQRVSIARALIVEPKVILADEPVSMLDVSTQAAVLKLLRRLVREEGLSMLYISHDLSTVAHLCDRVNVMYLGRIVERAPVMELLNERKHPYTQALFNAIPIPNPYANRTHTSLSNTPPDPIDIGEGCRFRDRCPERMDICEKTPISHIIDDGRMVACHLYYDHNQVVEEGAQDE